mgnify:CR=1 FL=1
MILIILSRYFCYMNICCEEKDTVRLLDKIDESAKRNNLTYYRNLLFNEFGVHNCFYCGKPLKPDKIDVDHFIPWSFIKDDMLWNLVLSCPHCNRQKNDKLPDETFLYILQERNKKLWLRDKHQI